MPELIHDIALRDYKENGKRQATDKGWYHQYTLIYDEVFAKLREEKIKILEIGVRSGGSMRLWAESFPEAMVYGIDIAEYCKQSETERIKIFIGDCKDEVLIEEVGKYGPFDIIIDDGSHFMNDQKTAFSLFWPLLRPKGIYVIEDLYTSYTSRGGDGWGIDNPESTISMLKGFVDKVNKQGGGDYSIESISFYRHICFIFKR